MLDRQQRPFGYALLYGGNNIILISPEEGSGTRPDVVDFGHSGISVNNPGARNVGLRQIAYVVGFLCAQAIVVGTDR